jgi:hypothetical protein
MDNTLGYEPGDVSSILAGGATLGEQKMAIVVLVSISIVLYTILRKY